MTELVRHALARRRRSTIIWAVSFGVASGLILATFLAFDPEALAEISKTLSPELQEAFGADEASLTEPAGYLAGQFLTYAPLVLGFYAITAGSRAIAGREAERTLDLIAAQPVERRVLPSASLIATTIGLAVILVVYTVLTALTAMVTGIDLGLGDVIVSAIGLFPITLLYGALALMLSAFLRRAGTVNGIAGALLVIAYLANTIALVVPDVDWLRWLTPFHYHGSPIEDGIDLGYQALLLAGAAAFMAAATGLYERRDIQA